MPMGPGQATAVRHRTVLGAPLTGQGPFPAKPRAAAAERGLFPQGALLSRGPGAAGTSHVQVRLEAALRAGHTPSALPAALPEPGGGSRPPFPSLNWRVDRAKKGLSLLSVGPWDPQTQLPS